MTEWRDIVESARDLLISMRREFAAAKMSRMERAEAAANLAETERIISELEENLKDIDYEN